ncbi:DUF4229 domain-containing protein [Streptomyces sp. ACA25]|uniref:DUF4229 domain-containing protein n=1 Tax=Streptomyces sp. ACA25 TaxID=3022596 RepID=UPI002307BB44|nr:DUF4229 domain-containing protein [Streptomyces sp. ACA25]MDB1090236.1 DUF4229 domain-containing protein [Streptomyces sp. ACA25]
MTDTKYATLRYTGMRLGVFAACFVVVAVLAYLGVLLEAIGTANPLWITGLAILISAPVSLVVLRKQREAMSEQIVTAAGHAKEKLRKNRSMEDDVADADADAGVDGSVKPG